LIRGVATSVLVAVSTASPQSDLLHMKPVDVTMTSAMSIEIRRGKQEWQVDLSSLVRAYDCVLPYSGNERICLGSRASPCPECPRHVSLITWDERHRKLYFAISTGYSWETPWTVFDFSLANQRITRFTNTWAAALVSGAVSPSGQFLTYVREHHMAPAAGCGPTTDIEIVDLWARRIARPIVKLPDSDGPWWIEHLNWTSRSTLEYVASSRTPDCRRLSETLSRKGRFDIADLSFR
jgi:hypothetical protein